MQHPYMVSFMRRYMWSYLQVIGVQLIEGRRSYNSYQGLTSCVMLNKLIYGLKQSPREWYQCDITEDKETTDSRYIHDRS